MLLDFVVSDLDCVGASGGEIPAPVSRAGASDGAHRYCAALDLSFPVASVVSQLTDRVQRGTRTKGRSPLSILAAAIFLVSAVMNTPRSLGHIRRAVGISETTIRYASKDILAGKDTLIDPAWFSDGKGDLSKLPCL